MKRGGTASGSRAKPINKTQNSLLENVTRNATVTEANWDLFRLFSVVAHTGSVNRAALELKMSQPTLSRRLKELERCVGAPLFFRASSGVKLTQEGRDLLSSAGVILTAFESFHRDLRSRVTQRSSVVKISATEGLTKHWLLPRVKRLVEVNRGIHLEITSSIHQQSVAESDLDFVIRIGDPGESELTGKRVAAVPFGIFASDAYLATHPAPRSVANLKDHSIIGFASDFTGIRSERAGHLQLFTEFFAASESGSVLRLMPVANHFAAAAQGLGLALLAIPFAQAEGGLVRVLRHESATLNVWLLRRPESDLRKLTREVRRFLESEFATSKKWLAGK